MKLWETFIRRTFGRYLTDEVLEELLNDSNGLRIGGERREVTILISDIRQSTELSEKMDPVSFFRMLNHYFEEMIEIINAWRGNILDFVGDSIVAVFGAPKPNKLSARDATACAVAMQRRMKAVNEWNLSQEYPEISMGIGIHTGEQPGFPHSGLYKGRPDPGLRRDPERRRQPGRGKRSRSHTRKAQGYPE